MKIHLLDIEEVYARLNSGTTGLALKQVLVLGLETDVVPEVVVGIPIPTRSLCVR